MNKNNYYLFFKKLSNKLKMDIILFIRNKGKTVKEISLGLNEERSKISHALIELKNCSIVNFKQRGKERVYSLNKDTIEPILKLADNHSKKYCGRNCYYLK